jgi:hypothetical protein
MNIEHTKMWTDELRATTTPQVRGNLAAPVDQYSENSEIGACCLGVLECVRLGVEPKDLPNDVGLPALEAADWLGVETDFLDHVRMVNFNIDYPYDLRVSVGIDAVDVDYILSATAMNDDLCLTFSQIADMVDYFGISEAEAR